jgi:hypothetical protein
LPDFSTVASDRASGWRKFLADLWPWAVGFIPAVVLLVLILPLRVPLPWHDGWAFVKQYELWVQGSYDWHQLFAPNFGHPSALPKMIYFAVLQWTREGIRLFPLITWGFCALTALGLGYVSRPLWSGSRAKGAALMFGTNLCLFSLALGHNWIWDILYQNMMPGFFLAAGLAVFAAPWKFGTRLWVAALISLLSTFSYGSGFLVGALLSLSVWHAQGDQKLARKALVTAVWLVANAFFTWVALKALVRPGDAMEAADMPIGLSTLVDRPWMRLQFVFIELGQILGRGTVIDPEVLCAVMGGTLLVIFLVCLVVVVTKGRNHPVLVTDALPWIVCCLFGIANAVMVCMVRMYYTFMYALIPRYGIQTVYFVVGVGMLVVVLCRHAEASGAVGRVFRRSVALAVGVFLTAQVMSWVWGWQFTNVMRLRMEQERAMLGFGGVVPIDPGYLWNDRNNNSTYPVAKQLSDWGRLKGVTFAKDARIASLPHLSTVNRGFASFDSATRLDDGSWKFTGVCRFSRDLSSLPDLVLVTAQVEGGEEKIVSLAPPITPDDFFDGQANKRGFPEHYFGWSGTAPANAVPNGAVTFHAYAYLQDTQRVRPIEGIQLAEPPKP